jgi:hypothetical protein
MQLIGTTGGIQIISAKGATKSEHQAWIEAAGLGEHITFGLKAYYTDNHDLTSFGTIDFTISDFLYSSRAEAIGYMETVYSAANGLGAILLGPYNITATDIQNFQTAIKDFTLSIPIRDQMKSSSKTATGQLPQLFATLRTKFELLDFYVGTFKATQPKFFEDYTNGRKIINLGKTMQAKELHLMPESFSAIFGKKFQEGHTFTIRNHSAYPIVVFLTDTPNTLPTANPVKIAGNTDLKLEVSKDFGGVFGHWLVIYNPNGLDDVHVTVILAHGKSFSKANELSGKVK